MKIAFCSHRFPPDVGGIETVSALLAGAFVEAGHEVRVLTQTRAADSRARTYQIVRRANFRELLAHGAWCDVFFQNNISLQNLWAGLLLCKPVVIAHHTWLTAPDGSSTWRTRLKKVLLRGARNIAISEAIADHIGAPSITIDNPLDTAIFRQLAEVPRDRDLVCLGRLVSDKGVDTLLDALGYLAREGCRPSLTVIGSGPEEAALRSRAAALGIAGQVEFAGTLTGDALATRLNRHRVIVVPSRWAEPFGLVALEGIACGCVAVGSDRGGLPRAIGPCGLTFPNGDATALAASLHRVLSDETLYAQLRTRAATHLERHSPANVAAAYLRVLSAAAAR